MLVVVLMMWARMLLLLLFVCVCCRKNGTKLRTAFRHVNVEQLYPTVGLHRCAADTVLSASSWATRGGGHLSAPHRVSYQGACLSCSHMWTALLLLHAAHKDGLCEFCLCAAKMSMYKSTLGSSHSSLI